LKLKEVVMRFEARQSLLLLITVVRNDQVRILNALSLAAEATSALAGIEPLALPCSFSYVA
jgi:hypothetical protein